MTHLIAISSGAIAGICVGAVVLLSLILFCILVPMKTYLSAMFSGCYISAFKLIALKFRKIDYKQIVENYIVAKKAHLHIKFNDLETHQIAGGSCHDVVAALIQASDAGIDLDFDKAKAIDLTMHDVLSAISSVITPKEIKISSIRGTTRDKFELEVTASITVKAKLQSYIGGFSDDTLQSKVTKYIAAKIISLADHKNATPYNLAEGILQANLDAKNSYQLLSCDVTSINIVRDVGAEMASNDLERIRIQSQIEADRQKNMAIIEAEQMKIKTQEMKTAVLEAEADVPRAIAEAIRDGRMSVMDYYKLMNLQADTAMRRSMIGSGDETRD